MPKKTILRVFSGKNQLGNLAAIEVCESKHIFNDTLLLQHKAKINKQPISAFIVADDSSCSLSYSIRWFSPTTEVLLCGHGALAAADLILSSMNVSEKNTQCLFSNKNITVEEIESRKYILYLPAVELVPLTLCSSMSNLFAAKVVKAMQTSTDNGYLVISLSDEAAVKNFDFDARIYSDITQRALIVTYRSEDHPELIFFRYFAPQYGQKEDGATGSAAPALAEFWQLIIDAPYHCKQLSATGGYYQLVRGDNKIALISMVCDA